jgi:hypothetical protein
MLPFLRKNQEAAMGGDDDHVRRAPDSVEYGTLDAIAEDMIAALESKDSGRLKSALESLCEHIQALDVKQDANI